MSFINTKFQEILLSGFIGVALTNYFSSIFHFGQISKFKRGVTPIKNFNQNFLWICASTHYVFHNYKVSRNSFERFQRSCANKKNRTNRLTDSDWLTDGSNILYPFQLFAWGTKSLWKILWQYGIPIVILMKAFYCKIGQLSDIGFFLHFIWSETRVCDVISPIATDWVMQLTHIVETVKEK
mgnify:CR=1 FL=1